ncbi:hypothetical protein GQ54DRAFT_296701 [Martensiomyces pterosporus]|nr:hypothetical protein GQ54DRAFT_296701 [Martensiomyces pterosporus]
MRPYWKHDPLQDEGRVGLIDPSMRKIVKSTAKGHLKLLVFLTVVLWTILCIFFGASHKRGELVYRLKLDLVNLDEGAIGQEITDMVMGAPHSNSAPTWVLNTRFSDISQVRPYAKKDALGVFVINKGLTERLTKALETGADYDPTAAITLLEQGSYHPLAQLMYIQESMAQMASMVGSNIAVQQLQRYRESTNATAKAMANLKALLNPISSTTENLGQYSLVLGPIVAPLSTMLMFLCIMVPIIMLKFGSYPGYKMVKQKHIFGSLVIIITVLSLIFSFFGTLAFMAFKGPDYNLQNQGLHITGGRFFSIWMAYLVTLLPTVLWIKTLVTFAPPAFVAVPTIMTIIPNMCASISVIELCPTFFKWFQGLPFYQGAMLHRYIISGAHERLGENLGILFGEIVFSLVLLYFTTVIHQHNVHNGVVDRMGWYRGSANYTGPSPKPPKEAPPVEASAKGLESGSHTHSTSKLYAPATVQITEEYTAEDAAMRDETVGI